MKKIIYNIFIVNFFILLYYGISLSAVDINGSYDTDVKVFGNCKVSLVTLKSGKKFVFLEVAMNKKSGSFFRIIFDKHKPFGYSSVIANRIKLPKKLPNTYENDCYSNIYIGDREYNVELHIIITGPYIIYHFNMPPNFLDLLFMNDNFIIDYDNWGPDKLMPISLRGFSEAMNYVKYLQASL